MTIASEISRLQQAKGAMKTAITNRGVPVGDSVKLDEYAGKINEISTGKEEAAAVQANLDAHTGNKANPHGVGAAQIGAATVTADGKVNNSQLEQRTLQSPTLVSDGATATWEEVTIPEAVLGAGWTKNADGSYSHAAGSTGVLAFPIDFVKDGVYEVKYTQTGASAENTFGIVCTNSADSASGLSVATNEYTNNDRVFIINTNKSYVNVIPSSNWTGNIKLEILKKCTVDNAAIATIDRNPVVSNKYNLFIGGGLYNTGDYNTATGYLALSRNTTGASNTATGAYTLFNNTIGHSNTATGREALRINTTGCYNTASGFNALCNNTTGSANTAAGFNALYNNTTANSNTAAGYRALYNNTTGSDNTANGYQALYRNTTGSYNTASGFSALHSNTTGHNNTASGYQAGRYLSNGTTDQTVANNSVFIGADSRGSADDNQTNQIVIGYQARGYGSNTAHIGNADVTSISFGAGTRTAFTNRSDPRIKEDIREADLDICYEDVKRLPLRRFKYKDFVGHTGDQHLTGFLSTEFEEVLPKAVHKVTQTFDKRDENGGIVYKTITAEETVQEIDPETGEVVTVTKQVERDVPEQVLIEDCASIDTSQLVPTLFGAVQRLMEKLEATEAEVAALKALCSK